MTRGVPGASAALALAVADAPIWLVGCVGMLLVVLRYGWDVLERPDLYRQWVDTRDYRHQLHQERRYVDQGSSGRLRSG